MGKKLIVLLAAIGLLVTVSPGAVAAEGGAIQIESSSAVSEFPEGARFTVRATSDSEITSIAVRFRIGSQTTGVYEYMDFEEAPVADSELFWRTNTIARYIPPGTMISYNFEIEDASGNRLETETESFVYSDSRFAWEEISEGPITVLYHGPVKTRAESVLDATIETLAIMGPLLGADTEEPIRITMYNNPAEMLNALPPGSTTVRSELITEGQAYVRVGTLLVLGNRSVRGTASHEMTHILTHRAGDSTFRSVPQWLDEGLSEYGNLDPSNSYDEALEFALITDGLLPITSMESLPGAVDDIIIFYGEARSIVRFMVAAFGEAAMRDLMAAMKSGEAFDDAVVEIYGVTRLELENLWREALGADPYVPADRASLAPTPVSRRTVLPYSLTPQPESDIVRSSDVAATSGPEPTAAPVQTGVAGEGDGPDDSGSDVEAVGSCSAPSPSGAGSVEVSLLAGLAGLVGLSVRRRRRQAPARQRRAVLATYPAGRFGRDAGRLVFSETDQAASESES